MTLPANIFPGDVIHIQTPENKLYEITVPQGAGPFSRLIVRISPSLPSNTLNPSYGMNTSYAQPSVPIVSSATVPGTVPIVTGTSPDVYATPYPPQKPITSTVYVPH